MLSFYNGNTKRFLSRFDKALVLIIVFCTVAAILFLITNNTVITTAFSIILTLLFALTLFFTTHKNANRKLADEELLTIRNRFEEDILLSSPTTFLTIACDCFSHIKGFKDVRQRTTHGICFYKGTYTAIKVIHPADNYNAIETIWRFAHQLSVLDITHGILVSAIPLEEKHYTAAKRVSGGKIYLYELDELLTAQAKSAQQQPYTHSFFSNKQGVSKDKRRARSAMMFFAYAFVILLSAVIVGAGWLRLFYCVLAFISAGLGLAISFTSHSLDKPIGKH